jgi:opacity protein-like surface antigen
MRASMTLALALATLQIASAAAQDTADPDDAANESQSTAAPKASESTPSALARPLSLGLLLGYGADLGNSYNFWGLGLGLRGGYNLRKIYLGGRFVYQFGESREDRSLGRVIRDYSWHHWDLGFELGYDLAVADRLIVRPELGLGFVNFTSYFRNTTSDVSDSTLAVYFALGATLTYDLTPDFFLGVDSRLQIVVGDAATEALTFMLHAGMRF